MAKSPMSIGASSPLSTAPGTLSPRSEEFARHIGVDLDSEEDRQHAWIAQKAVREALPDGWSQHEDEEGFLYFYDAILDRSVWEHPLEGHWKRVLDEERRKATRQAEIKSLQDDVANMANSAQGQEMVRDLRAKFLKADISELEIEMSSVRTQIEEIQTTIAVERGKADDEEAAKRKTTLQKQNERLKGELREMNTKMKSMLQRLQDLLAPPEDEKGEAPEAQVTPDAVKEMAEYLGINIFTEPHLIYIAKQALETPLPNGWEEKIEDRTGEVLYMHSSGDVSTEHPNDPEIFHLVNVQRSRLGHLEMSLFSDHTLKFHDQDGIPYYYNFRTDEISFDRPLDMAMKAASKIQARARGILTRARLEKQGKPVKRVEAPKESATKQKLISELQQRQMADELAKEREHAHEQEKQEELLRIEREKKRKAEAEAEAARVEQEKLQMLEQLRQWQQKQGEAAKKLQSVYRGHLARSSVELPWQKRARMGILLQNAYRCHRARRVHRNLLKHKKQAEKARKQVDAAEILQRIYRGHLGRKEFVVQQNREGPLILRKAAANKIKAWVVGSLYRNAFMAMLAQLKDKTDRYYQGEDVPETPTVDEPPVEPEQHPTSPVVEGGAEVFVVPDDEDVVESRATSGIQEEEEEVEPVHLDGKELEAMAEETEEAEDSAELPQDADLPPPSEDIQTEPLKIVLDMDYESWNEDIEEHFKARLCDVATMVQPDEIDILRVSPGSVIIDMVFTTPKWQEAVQAISVNMQDPDGILRKSLRVREVHTPDGQSLMLPTEQPLEAVEPAKVQVDADQHVEDQTKSDVETAGDEATEEQSATEQTELPPPASAERVSSADRPATALDHVAELSGREDPPDTAATESARDEINHTVEGLLETAIQDRQDLASEGSSAASQASPPDSGRKEGEQSAVQPESLSVQEQRQAPSNEQPSSEGQLPRRPVSALSPSKTPVREEEVQEPVVRPLSANAADTITHEPERLKIADEDDDENLQVREDEGEDVFPEEAVPVDESTSRPGSSSSSSGSRTRPTYRRPTSAARERPLSASQRPSSAARERAEHLTERPMSASGSLAIRPTSAARSRPTSAARSRPTSAARSRPGSAARDIDVVPTLAEEDASPERPTRYEPELSAPLETSAEGESLELSNGAASEEQDQPLTEEELAVTESSTAVDTSRPSRRKPDDGGRVAASVPSDNAVALESEMMQTGSTGDVDAAAESAVATDQSLGVDADATLGSDFSLSMLKDTAASEQPADLATSSDRGVSFQEDSVQKARDLEERLTRLGSKKVALTDEERTDLSRTVGPDTSLHSVETPSPSKSKDLSMTAATGISTSTLGGTKYSMATTVAAGTPGPKKTVGLSDSQPWPSTQIPIPSTDEEMEEYVLRAPPLSYAGQKVSSLSGVDLIEICEERKIWKAPLPVSDENRMKMIRLLVEDELTKDGCIIKVQSLYRGQQGRRLVREKVNAWLQTKEMQRMEQEIMQARQKGASTAIQRVSRGHFARVLVRSMKREIAEREQQALETRMQHYRVFCSKEASLVTRVCKGHLGRNLYRQQAEKKERERQLAMFDSQKMSEFDYNFDPDEDDADDTFHDQQPDDDQDDFDYGDDASPRAVTKWYEKVIYPERNFPWTASSIGTDVNTAAAVCLQTVYRAHLARLALGAAKRKFRHEAVKYRTTACRRIQMVYREYRRFKIEERRRLETELFELRTRSATLIQARYKGFILRTQVARRKAMEADLEQQRRELAAISMQALARGFRDRRLVMAKRKIWAEDQLVHRAATKIQSRWRGVMARGRMERVKADRKAYMAEMERREMLAKELRVQLIQAVYRGHVGRELYRERVIEVSAHKRLIEVKKRRAAVMFQGLYRGYVYRNRRRIRARTVRLNKAAARVQKVYRGHIARNDVSRTRFMNMYGHMSGAATTVANNYRMHLARRKRRQMVEVMHQAGMARFLQAVYRGHIGRNTYRHMVHQKYVLKCTILLQQAYRCHVARTLYEDFWQQAHEQKAVSKIQRVTRGHFARNQVREFLERKERNRQKGAATTLQRVYRGHIGRINARTEKNKLEAQYNMGWLTTYAEQLEKVAQVEHWDLFKDHTVEIAHKIRDLYATFEYEQAVRKAKAESMPMPVTPDNLLTKTNTSAEKGKDSATEDGNNIDPAQSQKLEDSKPATAQADPGPSVAPKIQDALTDIVGEESLTKPWNQGKSERVVQDLVELAAVTSQIRKDKIERAYNLRSGQTPGTAEPEEKKEEPQTKPRMDTQGFDLSLVLGKGGKKLKDRPEFYNSPQIAPSYMEFPPGQEVPRHEMDIRDAAFEVDIADKYNNLRNRQGMPSHIQQEMDQAVDRMIEQPNPWLADGPVMLGSMDRPYSPAQADASPVKSRPKQRRSSLKQVSVEDRLHSKPRTKKSEPKAGWDSSTTLKAEAGSRRAKMDDLMQQHERLAKDVLPTAPADLWAMEVLKDHNQAKPSKKASLSRTMPSPYQKGKAGIFTSGNPEREEEQSFRRDLTAVEQQSLEDLRQMLAESKVIQNISPALLDAAGLAPDNLSVGFAPMALGDSTELEILMEPEKKRRALKMAGGKKVRSSALPAIERQQGISVPAQLDGRSSAEPVNFPKIRNQSR